MARVYKASRLTSGNFLFPDTINVQKDGVHYQKRRILGADEEIINYHHIASVRVSRGMLFASLTIETSGGSQPITMHGLTRRSANELKKLIQQEQAAKSAAPPAAPVGSQLNLCPSCGQRNRRGANFCAGCGQKL